MKVDWRQIWSSCRKYVLNKYVITCAVFAVVLTFCGEHSLIKRTQRNRQIAELEEEVEEYREKLNETDRMINELNSNNEQLERFARERYLMRKPGEDVYIIEE